MRIQHNIMAMNAYRNYSNNTSALSKNLEKLSSGYKINRAGDDAAGLAISEKMRAQITGLDVAQKNAKDGISLVQTAEGALTEVHDMLNRMVELASQSANGTYDETDRVQLQKEVDQLRDEINRIADSSNFNGINLLDGSLSESGATSTSSVVADLSKLGIDITVNAKDVDAVKGQWTTETLFAGAATAGQLATGAENGDSVSFKLSYTDAEGKTHDVEYTLKIGKDKTGTNNASSIWLDDGSENGVWLSDLGTAGTVTNGDLTAAIDKLGDVNKDLKASFDITVANGQITFESRVPGTAGAKIEDIAISWNDKSATGPVPTPNYTQIGFEEVVKAEDAYKAYNLTGNDGANIFDLNAADNSQVSTKNIEDAIFEINGQKFAFIQAGTASNSDVQAALREAGVTHWVEVDAQDTIAAADITDMVNKIATATGLKVEQGTFNQGAGANGENTWTAGSTGNYIIFRPTADSVKNSGAGGLTLQIGDTSDDFNQLNVAIKDCHAKAIGIDGVDISTQDGAQAAVDVIKDAINYISDVRGTLGATQNRLDHTINNLSVMEENIQDAESSIRDTDVADEMMEYTKNNILIQSAQAMLAQANQVPQGVLQLLQ